MSDPYPGNEYRDGKDLFNKVYATEFFERYPNLQGTPYPVLRTICNDDVLKRIPSEFKTMNAKLAIARREWGERHPQEFEFLESARAKESEARRARKKTSGTKRGRDDNDDNVPSRRHPRSYDPEFAAETLRTVKTYVGLLRDSSDVLARVLDYATEMESYRALAEAEKRALMNR